MRHIGIGYLPERVAIIKGLQATNLSRVSKAAQAREHVLIRALADVI